MIGKQFNELKDILRLPIEQIGRKIYPDLYSTINLLQGFIRRVPLSEKFISRNDIYIMVFTEELLFVIGDLIKDDLRDRAFGTSFVDGYYTGDIVISGPDDAWASFVKAYTDLIGQDGIRIGSLRFVPINDPDVVPYLFLEDAKCSKISLASFVQRIRSKMLSNVSDNQRSIADTTLASLEYY